MQEMLYRRERRPGMNWSGTSSGGDPGSADNLRRMPALAISLRTGAQPDECRNLLETGAQLAAKAHEYGLSIDAFLKRLLSDTDIQPAAPRN